MKIPMALASAILLAGTVAGCGGDSDGGSGGSGSGYCKDLKQAKASYGDLSSGNLDELDEAFKTFHTLADEAPSEIDGDWKKLDGAITTVEKALKDAGLKFSDLAEIQKGKMPAGVDASKLQGLVSEMAKLSAADFTDASKAIETHAKKTCNVDLNGS